MQTLDINNGSAVLLYHMLGSDKWAKNPKQIYHAGLLMDQLESVKNEMPPNERSDEYMDWVKKPFTLEVKSRFIDSCKECVKYVTGQGLIRPSPVTVNPLLLALGLVEDDIEE